MQHFIHWLCVCHLENHISISIYPEDSQQISTDVETSKCNTFGKQKATHIKKLDMEKESVT